MQNTGCREELAFRPEPLPGEGRLPWLALAAHMAGPGWHRTWRSAAPPPQPAREAVGRCSGPCFSAAPAAPAPLAQPVGR